MSEIYSEASGVAGEFEEITCTLCGKNETDVILRGDGPAQIVRCRNDGLIYVNPRPTAAQIMAHFSRHYIRQDNIEMFLHFRTDILKREAAVINRKKTGGTLLDIGCATGTFLQNFGPNWRLYGVDTSGAALECAAAQNGVELYRGSLRQANFPSGHFDVICMLDTLYFLPDPVAELGEVHRILKDDGMLAIEIPGMNYRRVRDRGMLSWLIDGKWSRMTPEESHLYYYTPTTLRQLLEKTKFEVRDVVPEQASIRGDPVLRKINVIHFWLARSLFFITRGWISIAAKELYLGNKIR